MIPPSPAPTRRLPSSSAPLRRRPSPPPAAPSLRIAISPMKNPPPALPNMPRTRMPPPIFGSQPWKPSPLGQIHPISIRSMAATILWKPPTGKSQRPPTYRSPTCSSKAPTMTSPKPPQRYPRVSGSWPSPATSQRRHSTPAPIPGPASARSTPCRPQIPSFFPQSYPVSWQTNPPRCARMPRPY